MFSPINLQSYLSVSTVWLLRLLDQRLDDHTLGVGCAKAQWVPDRPCLLVRPQPVLVHYLPPVQDSTVQVYRTGYLSPVVPPAVVTAPVHVGVQLLLLLLLHERACVEVGGGGHREVSQQVEGDWSKRNTLCLREQRRLC